MPGIPTPNTDIAALVPATIKGRTSPIISTAPGERDGTRAGDGGGTDPVDPPYDPVGVIFADNFDDQPDWTSGMPENDKGGLKLADNGISGGWDVDIAQHAGTHTLPVGWNHARQTPAFAPSRGYPTKHETIEITAASSTENPNRVRGGAGKSLVMWRESTDGNWHNDGILTKVLDRAYNQIYIEFYFNFSNEMIANYYDETVRSDQNMSKLFRALCWDGTGDPFEVHGEAFTEHKVPAFLWQMEGRPTAKGGYGFRNSIGLSTRRTSSSTPGEHKFIDWDGSPSDTISTSYHPQTTLKQGGDALIDRLTGLTMDNTLPAINVDQVFGDETHWTKVAFYLELNSAPGASDGVFKQWIDDKCILDIQTVQWVAGSKAMPNAGGWTTIAFGGNDFFRSYPASEAYEHWYAFDDVTVRDSIPQELL